MDNGDTQPPAVPRQHRLRIDLTSRARPAAVGAPVTVRPGTGTARPERTVPMPSCARTGIGTGGSGPHRALPVVRINPTTRWRRWYPWAVLSLDLITGIVLSLGLSRTGPGLPLLLMLLGALVALIALNRGYEDRFLSSGTEEFRRILAAGTALAASTSTLALLADAPSLRMPALVGVPVLVAGVFLTHGGARGLRGTARRHGKLQQRAVVIGWERSVAELIRITRKDPGAGLSIVAACIGGTASTRVDGVPVLGGPADVLAVLEVTEADTVVVTSWSDVDPQELRRLTWDLEGSGVRVLVAPRISDVSAPRLQLRTVGGLTLLDVNEPEFTGVRRVLKIAVDYALTVPGLLLILPVLLSVAVAIRIDSPGPVLFRQVRIGKHGRPFVMHKFRTMYVDAEQRLEALRHLNENADGPLFKMREDPRITPVGRVLRRFSLDELPQLFDVLLGRMSLVGPRPPLPSEVTRYEQDTRRRLLVTPGITGLWQVSGRSDLSWEESVRLDLHYVENWFLGLDLSIIARTLSAVLSRRGAY
jgi:exopolysaccharide biosynthesis polyprenyl glycosylphosphotransferase